MSPFTHCSELSKIHWSEWVESVRKDVECTFGILKSRFRMLRDGIELHSPGEITNVFHTCCILHNMLLEHDGMDVLDDDAWELLNPQNGVDDDDYDEDGNPLTGERPYPKDKAPARPQNMVVVEEDEDHKSKRAKLVSHFEKSYRAGKVFWPRKLKEEHTRKYTSAVGRIQARFRK